MNRSISLPLTLAVVLASQLTLGGCNKKQDVAVPPTEAGASAPDMSSASAPMDSISSASAVAGSDAASAAMQAASR